MPFPRRLVKSFGALALLSVNLYVLHVLLVSHQVANQEAMRGIPIASRAFLTSQAAWVEPTENSIALELQRRVTSMHQRCDDANLTRALDFNKLPAGDWPWIYVSREYKMLYCQIPKVGTTNWLKLFAAMNNRFNTSGSAGVGGKNVHGMKLELLSYLKPNERKQVLRNFTKFLVVRDPFERALSAFRDKFEWCPDLKGPIFRKLSKNLVERYRTNYSAGHTSRLPPLPRFSEFVQFLVDPQGSALVTHYSEPRHWQPQNQLCFPCNIDYDYILSLDNIDVEAEFLLRSSGVPEVIKYPPRGSKKNQYAEMMTAYYGSVDPRLVNALYHYYALDYRIFDFSPPPQF